MRPCSATARATSSPGAAGSVRSRATAVTPGMSDETVRCPRTRDNVGALFDKGLCHSQTDALAGTGHDGHFVGKHQIHIDSIGWLHRC